MASFLDLSHRLPIPYDPAQEVVDGRARPLWATSKASPNGHQGRPNAGLHKPEENAETIRVHLLSSSDVACFEIDTHRSFGVHHCTCDLHATFHPPQKVLGAFGVRAF